MSKEHHLNTIVEIYTTGRLHNEFNDPKAEELCDYEYSLILTHCSNKNAEILNLGCGAGRETFALYRMGYHHVKGVDCTPALLETAREHSKTRGFNAEFILAFAHDLPFPDNSFDVVTMFRNLYGHITPHSVRLSSLAEIRRILKPGGLALMNVTSIGDSWCSLAFIRLQEILRLYYNPHGLEQGDKIIRGARRHRKGKDEPLARSHWFRTHEVPEDAKAIGLTVIQTTTNKGLLNNHRTNSTKVHKQGSLVYVLQRPV